MQREIKFRAWNEILNKMVYDLYVGNSCADHDDGFCYEDYIMQYTGLKDKNGKEIYEGDIVESNDHHWEMSGNQKLHCSIGQVCYLGELGMPRFDIVSEWNGIAIKSPCKSGSLPDIENCVVIGNIYENPEAINDININSMMEKLEL